MKIGGIDVGFGDVKCTYGTERDIIKIFKFPSVVAKITSNDLVHDDRVFFNSGLSYYVGEDALKLESSKIQDVTTYQNLERYTPLFLSKCLQIIGEIPDVINVGLSIAHIEQSGHYKESVSGFFVNDLKVKASKVTVIPQGIGAKIAFDAYGENFPDPRKDYNEQANYIGVDLGFNTVDVFQVINGKTTPNLIRGIENQGIIRVVIALIRHLKDEYQIGLSIKEGKDAIDNGYFRRRGKTYDIAEFLVIEKKTYLTYLESLIEQEFGKILDKVDFMVLFGGGAIIFRDQSSQFIRVPQNRIEYYNSIGYYLAGKNV